ncbi:MAG: discoidin domain-containing protein, partial [Sphingobacteriaceae bacterium]
DMPANPNRIKALLYRITSSADYSLVKFSVTHFIDFTKGLQQIVKFFHERDTPPMLQSMIDRIAMLIDKPVIREMMQWNKDKKLSLVNIINFGQFLKTRYKHEALQLIDIYSTLDAYYSLAIACKKYSFTFQPPAASTNTLLTLNLMNQGTAWFDMLQVSPDPVISYTITPNRTANVSLTTYTSNAELKYTLSNQSLATKPTVYVKPLSINSPQIITAQLFVNKVKVGETHKFIPVNQALSRPVKSLTPVSTQYPAQGDKSLTDGQMASTSFKDPNWLGFTGNEVILQLDMQQVAPSNKVTLNLLCDANSGIFLPKEAEVAISDDGISFITVGKIANEQGSIRGEPYLKPFAIAFSQKKARYIRIKASSIGKIPNEGYLFPGTNPWIFIDEILVE